MYVSSVNVEANYVDALYITSPLHVFVRDSTFEPLVWGGKTVAINPQVLPGMMVQGSCQQHPCAQGSLCTYANFSSSCQPCPDGTYSGDGISCELCPPGTGPSADQTSCEPCGGAEDPRVYSSFGVCLQCHGDNVVSTDRTSCMPQGPSLTIEISFLTLAPHGDLVAILHGESPRNHR